MVSVLKAASFLGGRFLFKAQTDGLKIDEHRMMNGKKEEANV